ncbi:Gremlin-1 [Dirofilaria immitis]
MRIGIIGRAFTDRPSRIIIALLLKSMTMLIPSKYLLLPADGTPIVNIGIVDQSATTSSAGYIQYKVENGSIFDEISKKAFISLHSEPYIEPPLLTFDQKRLKWLQRYMRKQLRSEKKSRKVISSPKEALHQVNQEVSLGKLDDSRHAAHCDGQIFKQRIRMDGCLSKVVHNRFCHGTCSSYFIPRLRPRKLKLDAMFQSCSVCRPTEWDTVEVKLDCPRKNPKELKRKVIKVKKCKCIALSGSNLESDEDGRIGS